MRVSVDIFFVRIDGARCVFQVSMIDLGRADMDPDGVVADRALRRHPELAEAGHELVIHSTSWRRQGSRILLTYLVYSDQLAFRGRVRRLRLSEMPSPQNTKSVPSARALASHALRHLAFLYAEDPSRYDDRLATNTRRQLKRLRPAVAGRLRR